MARKKKKRVSVVLLLALLFALGTLLGPYVTPRRTVKVNVKESVVKLVTQLGAGSGFFIKYDGRYMIITAGHVAFGINSAKIYNYKNERLDYKIVGFICPGFNDIAILFLEGVPDSQPFLTLARTAPGKWCIASGYPFAGSYKSYIGKLIGTTIKMIGKELRVCIISDCKLQPGMSGGPLVNLDGQVLGVNYGTRGMTSAFIPAKYVSKYLKLLDKNF